MNKYEYELKKLEISNNAKTKEWWFKSLQNFMVLTCIGVCFYFLLAAIQGLVKANPDALTALAVVIEKLNFVGITSVLVGISGFSYGMYERRTRKKLERNIN
ncbi:hypothetical protein [Acinetobacter courvalinii]|uniref:hypothetical protein n=1 Tax=Acinetobacter courvalinii TaxID=280147 RepID=UPI00289ACA22|nr:hypothetical protein [Acinetobacter courvalinii]